MSDQHQEFLLRLRTVGDDRLAIHDLRRFLKALIRGYPRLRCVEAVEVPGGAVPVATGPEVINEASQQASQR